MTATEGAQTAKTAHLFFNVNMLQAKQDIQHLFMDADFVLD